MCITIERWSKFWRRINDYIVIILFFWYVRMLFVMNSIYYSVVVSWPAVAFYWLLNSSCMIGCSYSCWLVDFLLCFISSSFFNSCCFRWIFGGEQLLLDQLFPMAICEQLPLLHIVILYNSNAREPISGEKETLTSLVEVEVSGYVGKQNSALL